MARARLSASGGQGRRRKQLGGREKTREEEGARESTGRQGGGTCKLSLLGQVGRAGAAGDAHQGGCDLGVTAVHIQVTAGQGQLWNEAGTETP